MNVHKILCPVDFSERTADTIAYATTLAKPSNSEVHIVYVHQEAPVDGGFAGYVPIDDTDQERAQLETLSPSAPDVRCVRAFLHGDAEYQIVKYADDHDIDLIVIATHGRTGLMRMLMGSVAEAVVRRASCPVITIKHPTEKAEADESAKATNPAVEGA